MPTAGHPAAPAGSAGIPPGPGLLVGWPAARTVLPSVTTRTWSSPQPRRSGGNAGAGALLGAPLRAPPLDRGQRGAHDAGLVLQLGRLDGGAQVQQRNPLLGLPADPAADHEQVRGE